MSAPGGAPSPGPRSGSMGPGVNGNGMAMPSQQPLPGTPVHSAPTPGPSAPPSGAMSQQNLNQIVGTLVIYLCVVREVLLSSSPLFPLHVVFILCLSESAEFEKLDIWRHFLWIPPEYGDRDPRWRTLRHFASTSTILKMQRALEHPIH